MFVYSIECCIGNLVGLLSFSLLPLHANVQTQPKRGLKESVRNLPDREMTKSSDLLFKDHGYVSDGGQYLLLHFCQDDLKLHEFFFR